MHPQSLRSRVNIAILAACVAMALFFGLLLYPVESGKRRAGLEKIQLLMTVLYEQNKTALANEVFAGQELALQHSLAGIVAVKGIVLARVYDLDNRLLSAMGEGSTVSAKLPVDEQEIKAPVFWEDHRYGIPCMVFATPIEVIGEKVGYFKMAYDLGPLQREMLFSVAFFMGMLLSILLIMSILLNFILSRFFITRISHLRDAIQKVQEGHFGETIIVKHQDEIGDVVQVFNKMSLRLKEQHEVISAAIEKQKADARQLAESNRALERLNAELETKVAERTADLVKSNEQLRQFKTISDRASYGTIITSLDGKVLYANKAFAAMHGREIEEVTGAHLSIFHTREQLKQIRRLAQLIQDEDGFAGEELWHTRKDGAVFPVLMSASLIRDSHGRPLYCSSTAIDISLRKSLEEKLLLRQRIDSLGTLAGGMAHDFNNILSGVTGYLDLLALDSRAFSPTQKKFLENAQTSVQRASDLIRRFQQLSKGNLSRQASVDVYAIAQDVRAMLETPSLDSPTCQTQILFSKGCYFAMADPSELQQVFLNLMLNARDAIEALGPDRDGIIQIAASDYRVEEDNGEALPPGDYIHISVSDNGCGMSERIRQKAFDPLFTTKDRYNQRGQGLGLAMVFTIVQRHGGMVSIDSAEGEGTRFHIFLPKGVPE